MDEVQVKLSNGTVEKGDIVLGADGVHSVVRELMWKNANKSQPGVITAQEKKCKISRSIDLYGRELINALSQPSQLAGTASLAWALPPQRWVTAR